jgi:hypothetical protein
MSWENRYRLPWKQLDLQEIEKGLQYVVSKMSVQNPLRRTEIKVQSPDRISCFVEVTADEERSLDFFASLNQNSLNNENEDSQMGYIEVEFVYLEADAKHELEAETYFVVRSNRSGNYSFPNAAGRVGNLFGQYFGVKCEPM